MPRLLDPASLDTHLDPFSAGAREVVLMLRDLVLDAAPGVGESIKLSSLCSSVPDAPYGVIGGNVCMISVRDGGVSLGFIQGAELPDPAGLLTGSAKAKREVPIPAPGAACEPELRALIVASHRLALERCEGRP